MPNSRRGVLAAGAGLAALGIAGAARAVAAPSYDAQVMDLIRHSIDSNAALMRGDIATFRSLVRYTDDFTLMSPFGGTPTHASEITDERTEAMGRFFKNGTFRQELVQAYGSADMVVLAVIERTHCEVGGLPAQDWALRVTLVYRRDGRDWRLAHRHADPLVDPVSLAQSAALARGERS